MAEFVTKLAPVGKIAEPGIYSNLDIDRYHSDCCDGPSISSSGLRTLDDCPALYWCDSYLNPDRDMEDDDEKEHFTFGQAAHLLFLGETGFASKFVLQPEEAPDGRAWNANNLSCKAWKAEQALHGRKILKADHITALKGMARSMANDPILAETGCLHGAIEQSLIWKDKETGVYLKARPDIIPEGGDAITDLKTVEMPDFDTCQRSLTDHNYHMQLALIGMGIEALTGRRLGNEDYVLVFVGKKRPWLVNIKPIEANAIWYGRMLIRRAIRKFADCLEKNEWPGFPDSGQSLGLAPWRVKQLENEIKYSLLDPDGE